MKRAVAVGLRQRRVDVVTAYEDGASELGDAELLDRATALGRALFTQDDDLLTEAAVRQVEGRAFSGLIYAHQLQVTIGTCVEQLELIATVLEPDELRGRVIFLPL